MDKDKIPSQEQNNPDKFIIYYDIFAKKINSLVQNIDQPDDFQSNWAHFKQTVKLIRGGFKRLKSYLNMKQEFLFPEDTNESRQKLVQQAEQLFEKLYPIQDLTQEHMKLIQEIKQELVQITVNWSKSYSPYFKMPENYELNLSTDRISQSDTQDLGVPDQAESKRTENESPDLVDSKANLQSIFDGQQLKNESQSNSFEHIIQKPIQSIQKQELQEDDTAKSDKVKLEQGKYPSFDKLRYSVTINNATTEEYAVPNVNLSEFDKLEHQNHPDLISQNNQPANSANIQNKIGDFTKQPQNEVHPGKEDQKLNKPQGKIEGKEVKLDESNIKDQQQELKINQIQQLNIQASGQSNTKSKEANEQINTSDFEKIIKNDNKKTQEQKINKEVVKKNENKASKKGNKLGKIAIFVLALGGGSVLIGKYLQKNPDLIEKCKKIFMEQAQKFLALTKKQQ